MSSKRSFWCLCIFVALAVTPAVFCNRTERDTPKEWATTQEPVAPPEQKAPSEPMYVSAEGRFLVRFPAPPTVRRFAVPAGDSTSYMAEAAGLAYNVSWIDVGEKSPAETKAYLEEVSSTFAGLQVVLRTWGQAEIALDGRPGRKLVVQMLLEDSHNR